MEHPVTQTAALYLHAGLGGATPGLARLLLQKANRLERLGLTLPERPLLRGLAGLADPAQTPGGSVADLAAAAAGWPADRPVLLPLGELGRMAGPGPLLDLLQDLGRPLRVIFHLLPQERLLAVEAAELALAGAPATALDTPGAPLPHWYEYDTHLGGWADRLGAQALVLRPAGLDRAAMAKDLLQIAGLPGDRALRDAAPTRIRTLDATALELALRLNRRAEAGDSHRAAALAALAAEAQPLDPDSLPCPTPEAAAALRARFAAGNAALLARLAPGQDPAEFFPAGPVAARGAAWSLARIAALTGRMLGGKSAESAAAEAPGPADAGAPSRDRPLRADGTPARRTKKDKPARKSRKTTAAPHRDDPAARAARRARRAQAGTSGAEGSGA